MKRLTQLIDHLENYISKSAVVNSKISVSSVGWHIDHTLIVFNQIVGALKRSDPANYRWKFNFWRTVIYSINKIPRGKVKAPPSVLPKTTVTTEHIKSQLNEARLNLVELELFDRNSYFRHPFFGDLNLKPTIKFLKLHTNHHLKIIDEILH